MTCQFFIFRNFLIPTRLLIEDLVSCHPLFSDSKNLGTAISIPYFWSVNEDKNFTLNSKLFVNENPLITGEYHQALKR